MRTKATKVFSLILTIILISAILAPVAMANSKVNDARRSILRVVAVGDYGIYTGSAFVIAQSGQVTTLVTNLHIVSGQSQVLIIPDNISGSWIPATVTFLPDGLDLALLTTTTGLANRPVLPLSRAETAAAADAVYALGFPGAADDVLDDWDMLLSSTEDVTITNGVVGRNPIELDNGVRAIQSNVPVTYGNSGGPLLNERAEVVGVNTWIYAEGAYQNSYSIHIDYIIDECIQRGIPYVAGGGNFFTQYWWLLAIIGGVVALGILAIVLGMSQSKRNAARPAYAAAGAAPAMAGAYPPPGAPGPGYPQQPGYAAPQQAASGRQLFCTKGQLAGNSFPLHTKLAIGRDAQRCEVAYPADAKGISSMHCEIMVQQGGVYLTDKGSTYGTFLAGGQKLAANQSVMLQPGATFYLADPVNEFKIT